MLSANDQENDVAHGFELGADDYLAKPFKEFELRARPRVGMRIIEAQNTLVKTQQALQFQATHDPLTRVWNRGGILDLLKKEIARAFRENILLSACLMDLDHFKLINDTYGHLIGDAVLQKAASRMADVLREYDSLGRYGGEEFLAVLPTCCAETAAKVADRMRKCIADEAMICSPCILPVTISLGVCEWRPGMDITELLQKADAALYQAKAAGRNRTILSTAPSVTSDNQKILIETNTARLVTDLSIMNTSNRA